MSEYFKTDELEKLSGYLGYNSKPAAWWTPKAFDVLPKNKRPEFLIKNFDGDVQIKVLELYHSRTDGKTITEDEKSNIIRDATIEVCLLDWRNYRTSSGTPIKFDFSKINKVVPVNLLIAIYTKIMLDNE